MKSFSKLFLAGLAATALTLTGCTSATTDTPTTNPPVVVAPLALPLDLAGMASVSSNITLGAGENNLNATYPALSLVTDHSAQTNQWVLDYGTNVKKWVDEGAPARTPEAKALQFTVKAVGPATEAGKTDGMNAYTVLTFKNMKFTDIANKTGITFSVKINGLTSAGVKATIRAVGAGGDVNASAWTTPLNDAPNTGWDWVWFGHTQFVNFQVPFSVFVKAAGASQTEANIAAAVAAGTVFDQFELKFRMDTGDNGVKGTDYTAFIDNVKLY